jgi:hypothetical protein
MRMIRKSFIKCLYNAGMIFWDLKIRYGGGWVVDLLIKI